MESKNKDVAKFLEDTKIQDNYKFEILQRLRAIAFEAFPNMDETFKYGGIMFSEIDEFGGLFLYNKHVSFEFSYGYKLTTPLKLEGNGKYRRHLKFKELSDINKKELKALLNQLKTMDKN